MIALEIGSRVVTPRGETGRILEIVSGASEGAVIPNGTASVMLDKFTVPHLWPVSMLRQVTNG